MRVLFSFVHSCLSIACFGLVKTEGRTRNVYTFILASPFLAHLLIGSAPFVHCCCKDVGQNGQREKRKVLLSYLVQPALNNVATPSLIDSRSPCWAAAVFLEGHGRGSHMGTPAVFLEGHGRSSPMGTPAAFPEGHGRARRWVLRQWCWILEAAGC